MPYLTQEQKEALDNGMMPDTPGALNYVITRHALMLAANDDVDKLGSAIDVEISSYLASCGSVNYEAFNAVVGVLTCAHFEWVRRRGISTKLDLDVADTLLEARRAFYASTVAAYEDYKITQNGDVYIP